MDADAPYRPEIVLWVELPDGAPVGVAVLDPSPPPLPLASTLLEAMSSPLAGPSRRPRRIRVADEVDAAEVRAAVGSTVEVVVAPTPELAALLEAMAEDPSLAADASYFEDGRIPPELVANVFAAAHLLHAAAPWNHAGEEQTLRMDIPALGVEGACVSIIGALGQSRGVLVFPSQTSFRAFLDVAESGPPREGPADLGTTVLSLTLDRADELPPAMRRESLEYGWPVAALDAYPLVEHRDRDGVPRPLTDRDVRIATACAMAVAAFTTSHGHIFSADGFEPVSVTFPGDDEVAVRLTAPYEALDIFEPDPEQPAPPGETVGEGRPRPSRNAPCWCGSGTKYKRCHLAADEARDAPPPPIHTVGEHLVQCVVRFATRRFGGGWLDDAERHFDESDAAVQLFLPLALYHLPVDGRPVVDWFLAEEGRRLSSEERSWLEAQRSAWLGVWEVLEVDPGRGVEVRDLLTAQERHVTEVSGSRVLVARDAVLGRVVDHGGLSVFAGVHPRPLSPEDAAEVVRAMRRRVRRRRDIPADRLRDSAIERYLLGRWEEGVASMDARHSLPPILHNFDGDELLFTTDHFAYDPSTRARVEAALTSIESLEGPTVEDDTEVYTFVRAEDAGAAVPGGTVLGRLRLEAAQLVLETNSLARADALRGRLEVACTGLLEHCEREHTSLRELAERGDDLEEDDEPPPSPEAERALTEWLDGYYHAWLDRPVPALGDLTPREAARTRAGRDRVDVLLKEMENRAARAPRGGRADVAQLRAEIGMQD